jgi:YgiT-type zinc finger domain-containing protein
MRMKCVYCGGTVTAGTTTDHYRWGSGYLVVVENVPCGICRSCGEEYFEASVVRQVEMLAQPLIRKARRPSRKPIAVIDYTHGPALETPLGQGTQAVPA